MSHPANMQLPSQKRDKFVTVSALFGGSITLPERFFVKPAIHDACQTVPSLAFLITHKATADEITRIMFDLGLRSTEAAYTEAQRKHLLSRKPYTLGPGIADLLADGGILPGDIDMVILSHVHYDHHGDPCRFPKATFIIGPGTGHLLEHGMPHAPSHQHFSPNLLPQERTVELPALGKASARFKWERLGDLDVVDLFGDGSVYVINSPGHLPGHINLLCRTGRDQWVCLCGDAYHDRRLLSGECEIAQWVSEEGRTCCIHTDPKASGDFLHKLRELAQSINVKMISAHDAVWYGEHADGMFPDCI